MSLMESRVWVVGGWWEWLGLGRKAGFGLWEWLRLGRKAGFGLWEWLGVGRKAEEWRNDYPAKYAPLTASVLRLPVCAHG
jgi:hypothetical protein